MRIRWFPVIVAALALAALTVHFVVPFAHVVAQDADGAVVRDDVLSLGDYQAERDAAETSIIPTGAGFGYQLTSLIFLAAGGIVLAIAAQFTGRSASWTQVAAGSITAIGAAMTLHNQGLWAGRGFSSWVQRLMGWDNPPASWAGLVRDHSSADVGTYLTTISPGLVVALTIVLVGVLAKAWSGLVRSDRDMRQDALRHGRTAFIGALVFALVAIVPWVVTVMPGSVQTGADVPDDTFFWSAYDVMYFRDVSWQSAQEAREAGLELWGDLDVLVGIVMLTSLAAVLAPFAGLAGKQMESLQQPVFGRLVESVSLATVLLHPFTVVAALLASFALHDPNEIFAARTTGIAMIAGAGGLAGTVFALLSARAVVADDTGIIADDFPEPVVYD